MSKEMLFAAMRMLEAIETDMKLYTEQLPPRVDCPARDAQQYIRDAILAIDEELSSKYKT